MSQDPRATEPVGACVPAPGPGPAVAAAPVPPSRQVLEIAQAVAGFYGIGMPTLLGPMRSKKIARARQVAIWLSRERTGLSYPDLGRLFERHHTTAMHAVDRTRRRIARDVAFRHEMQELERTLPRRTAERDSTGR